MFSFSTSKILDQLGGPQVVAAIFSFEYGHQSFKKTLSISRGNINTIHRHD